MARPLPPFQPLKLAELRAVWARCPDPAVQRLTLEVVRSREVLAEIDHLYKIIHQEWRRTEGGNLIALHLLQQLLDTERERLTF